MIFFRKFNTPFILIHRRSLSYQENSQTGLIYSSLIFILQNLLYSPYICTKSTICCSFFWQRATTRLFSLVLFSNWIRDFGGSNQGINIYGWINWNKSWTFLWIHTILLHSTKTTEQCYRLKYSLISTVIAVIFQ